ncbi:DUF4097 family beta strand repeat protein [Paenibacillus athensensis]|uniref:DUF4097 domain-containing protein n=1 Tax=Paenibacillus athensensis TaxID=1967502 RepID=A0A4Y8Q4H6_9BACL|nr:DUF4097 family beta strand repeat-containing protein [Paenibacillus athensensis]MCD1260811.1 DUF4097 family beta strand repeat protein [Paenibacillus athensensis]
MKLTMKFILLLGVACLVVGLIGTAATLKDVDWNTAGVDIDLEKKLPAADIRRFSIEADTTPITFLPSSTDEIVIHLKGTVSEQQAEYVNIDTDGSGAQDVKAVIRTDKKFHIGISVADIKSWMSDYRLRAEVELPGKLYDELRVKTDIGSIELNDVKAQTLIGQTNTGRIHVGRFEGQSLQLQTDTGGIEVEEATGDVRLQTDTGSIRAGLRDPGKTISASSDIGSIGLRLLSPLDSASFDLTSDIGGIDFSVPGAAVDERERHRLHGTLGDGSGTHIRVQTDTGHIEVTK